MFWFVLAFIFPAGPTPYRTASHPYVVTMHYETQAECRAAESWWVAQINAELRDVRARHNPERARRLAAEGGEAGRLVTAEWRTLTGSPRPGFGCEPSPDAAPSVG